MKRDTLSLVVLCALLVGLIGWQSGAVKLPSWVSVVSPAVKVSAATYVYEGKQSSVPPPVSAAISELNAAGIMATAIDDDVVTASGKIPKQYEAEIPAARAAGLPCLVVRRSDGTLKILAKPTTKAEVLEASK